MKKEHYVDTLRLRKLAGLMNEQVETKEEKVELNEEMTEAVKAAYLFSDALRLFATGTNPSQYRKENDFKGLENDAVICADMVYGAMFKGENFTYYKFFGYAKHLSTALGLSDKTKDEDGDSEPETNGGYKAAMEMGKALKIYGNGGTPENKEDYWEDLGQSLAKVCLNQTKEKPTDHVHFPYYKFFPYCAKIENKMMKLGSKMLKGAMEANKEMYK